MKIFFLKNKKAFSVLEVVVALTIITIGLLGVSSLVIQNIKVESVNKNYLIASMLAQEGLELVRNIRDANWINPAGVDWYNLIECDPLNPTDTIYGLDINDPVPIYEVDNIDDSYARLYVYAGLYQNTFGAGGAGEATPFYRIITSTKSGDLNNGGHLNISCLVQWTERGQTHKYEAATELYDWR